MNLNPTEFLEILRDFCQHNFIQQAFLEETTFIMNHLEQLLSPEQIRTDGFVLLSNLALEDYTTARLHFESLDISAQRIDEFLVELQDYQATLKSVINSIP